MSTTKRIIGTEYDFVRIQGKEIYVNGDRLEEPYAEFGDEEKGYGDVTNVTVPRNKLFVVGDNREVSLDSRYSRFGLVDVSRVTGKPLLILWSRDKSKILKRLQK